MASARAQRKPAANGGGIPLLTVVSEALEAHSAAQVADALCRDCGLTRRQADPDSLPAYLDTLLTQQPDEQQLQLRLFEALTPLTQVNLYTDELLQVELPTVRGSSRREVTAALQQLTHGHLAGTVAKHIVIYAMHVGLLRHASRLAGEAHTHANLAEAALAFLQMALLLTTLFLPPALLPVPEMDAIMTEEQLLGASMRMLTQPGGARPSLHWYCQFSDLLQAVMSQTSIVVTQYADICNHLLTAAEDACRAIGVTRATTEEEAGPITCALHPEPCRIPGYHSIYTTKH